jgi:hypothetical protein
MKSLQIVILMLAMATLARAAEPEFKGVVHAIEQTYGVHHMRIPFLGLALFIARPAGASGVRLAVFEGFETPADLSEVSRVVEGSLGPDWYPFVRVHSNHGKDGGESTLIYTNPTGGAMRMMIVNLESSEATVVEVKLNERTMRKWFNDTEEEAKSEFRH